MAEPLNATFFTLKTRDRAVLLPATLVMIVLVGAITAAFIAANWGFVDQVMEMIRNGDRQPNGDEETARFGFGIMAFVFSAFLFLVPLYFVLAAYEAACLRWMIRGEAPGLFGITFNNDTWRVYGIYWCWWITQLAASMAVGMLTMPFMFMMMGDIAAGGASDPNSPEWLNMQLRMQSLSLLQYIPLAFIGIRLGPAAATSIARKRFSFFDAWKVTRDRFWSLLGSYALVAVICAVIYVGAAALTFFTVYGGAFDGDINALVTSPDAAETFVNTMWERINTPTGWTYLGVGYAFMIAASLVWYLLSYGINARAALVALEEGKISVYQGDDD